MTKEKDFCCLGKEIPPVRETSNYSTFDTSGPELPSVARNNLFEVFELLNSRYTPSVTFYALMKFKDFPLMPLAFCKKRRTTWTIFEKVLKRSKSSTFYDTLNTAGCMVRLAAR